MNKKFVDTNIKIHEGKEAEELLLKKNDSKFLSKEGIVEISKERWYEAQVYENKTWNIDGLGASDDHNLENISQFDNFKCLKRTFENAIELGSGPFTNIYLIKDKLDIKKISILDPLLNIYIKHPNHHYQHSWITHSVPIEEFICKKEYDLVIMINVLEHCFNINLIFDKIREMLLPNGIFVFGDIHFSSETIQEMSQNAYNAGHPIRMETCFLNKQLESFPMLFRKEIKTTCAGRDAFEIYYIGKKK